MSKHNSSVTIHVPTKSWSYLHSCAHRHILQGKTTCEPKKITLKKLDVQGRCQYRGKKIKRPVRKENLQHIRRERLEIRSSGQSKRSRQKACWKEEFKEKQNKVNALIRTDQQRETLRHRSSEMGIMGRERWALKQTTHRAEWQTDRGINWQRHSEGVSLLNGSAW